MLTTMVGVNSATLFEFVPSDMCEHCTACVSLSKNTGTVNPPRLYGLSARLQIRGTGTYHFGERLLRRTDDKYFRATHCPRTGCVYVTDEDSAQTQRVHTIKVNRQTTRAPLALSLFGDANFASTRTVTRFYSILLQEVPFALDLHDSVVVNKDTGVHHVTVYTHGRASVVEPLRAKGYENRHPWFSKKRKCKSTETPTTLMKLASHPPAAAAERVSFVIAPRSPVVSVDAAGPDDRPRMTCCTICLLASYAACASPSEDLSPSSSSCYSSPTMSPSYCPSTPSLSPDSSSYSSPTSPLSSSVVYPWSGGISPSDVSPM